MSDSSIAQINRYVPSKSKTPITHNSSLGKENPTNPINPRSDSRVLKKSSIHKQRVPMPVFSVTRGNNPSTSSDFSRMLSNLGNKNRHLGDSGLNGYGVCKDLEIIKSKGSEKSWKEHNLVSWDSFVNVQIPKGAKDLHEKTKIFGGLNLNPGLCVLVSNKHPSKLLQTQVLLECKIKKNAYDVQQTKKILDTNNSDALMAVLLNIQEVSGIEKTFGHVPIKSLCDTRSLKSVENNKQCAKLVQNSQSKKLNCVPKSVLGMSSEELEARILPHCKLLRNPISVLKTHQPICAVSDFVSKSEDMPLKDIGKNLSTKECLDTMSNEQSKTSMRIVPDVLDFNEVHEMDDSTSASRVHGSSNMSYGKTGVELLRTDETIDEFDDQENQPDMMIGDGAEDTSSNQLNEIGPKTSTGGWFVSEGESVILAHYDGSCSFYDIANCEGKGDYKPPSEVSPNLWRDCWIIRAPGVDGSSGKYVVAASAGNTMESGFCSWDFYTQEIQGFHINDAKICSSSSTSRTALSPMPNAPVYRRNVLSSSFACENQQWWYTPCGPLIVSSATCQRVIKIYDIRDGELVMKWDTPKPVITMDYSNPLQWKNRGKLVISEADSISLYDVSSINPQPLQSVTWRGLKVTALHVNNADAELGGGIRQRLISLQVQENDGVFCTSDSINIIDFRKPSGVGLKIPKHGVNVQSVFSCGDSIVIGCTNIRPGVKNQSCSQVYQMSLRKQQVVSSYCLPESNAHSHYAAITQVWGNSSRVMGVCGLGLFVFDAYMDDDLQSSGTKYGNLTEVIGSDDLYYPSFDYSGSHALLISRDRPACWKHLS